VVVFFELVVDVSSFAFVFFDDHAFFSVLNFWLAVRELAGAQRHF
jgi:hypothetical protein